MGVINLSRDRALLEGVRRRTGRRQKRQMKRPARGGGQLYRIAKVKVRKSDIHGLGLFAAETIPPGNVIATLEKPTQVSGKQLKHILEAAEEDWPPFDSIIHQIDPSSKTQRTITWSDKAFHQADNVKHAPNWYWMNHNPAETANVKIQLSSQGVEWTNKFTIQTNEELTWPYSTLHRPIVANTKAAKTVVTDKQTWPATAVGGMGRALWAGAAMACPCFLYSAYWNIH